MFAGQLPQRSRRNTPQRFVVHHPAPQVIVNAGSKMLGSDRPAWVTGFGRVMGCPDARIVALSEHHGTIDWPVDAELPALGQTLALIPNHVCVTMNLVDEVTVVDGDAVVDRWRVAARGRNR